MADVLETTEEETEVSPAETPEPEKTGTPAPAKGEEEKLKRESQGLRKRLRETEERETGLKTKLETLEGRTQRIDVHDALTAQSTALGIKEFELVKDLVLANRGALKFGEDGKVEGLKEALDAIRAKHPTLFFDSPGKVDGAATGDAKPAFRLSEWIKGQ